jgi:hypothetical protein
MILAGLYSAVVMNNADPLQKNRLLLQVPQLTGYAVTDWALPVLRGVLLPAIGDNVWVAFQAGDITHPLWIGGQVA